MSKKRLEVWHGAYELIKYRPRIFFGNLFFVTFFMVSQLFPGWLEKLFYDQLVVGDGRFSLSLLLLGIVCFEFIRVGSSVLGEWNGARMRNSAAILMRRNLFQRFFERPGAEPLAVSPGDTISRLDDELADFADFPTWAPEIVGSGLYALLAIVIMVQINWLITVVAVLPLASLFFLNRYAWQKFLHYARESRESDSAVTSFLGELLGNVQAMKVAGAETGVIHYFKGLNDRRRVANVQYQMFWSIFQAISDHMGDVAVAIMVVMAGGGVANGSFTIGDFALFTTYLFFVARFPAILGSFISEMAQQRVVLDRLQELLPEDDPTYLVQHNPIYEAESVPAISAPIKRKEDQLQELRVAGLRYLYEKEGGERVGVQDISFTLKRNQLLVITGGVGSGKTTLLRLLLGLLPAQAGEIYWNGALVETPAHFFVPPRAAYTPQLPRLFSNSVRENILLGLPDVGLVEAVEAAVLQPDIERLERGLETVVGPRGVRLSGGQIQRTAAARMIVRQSELLVFDDISSALDVETEEQLWDHLFAQQRAGKSGAMIVVTHRKQVIDRADLLISLGDEG